MTATIILVALAAWLQLRRPRIDLRHLSASRGVDFPERGRAAGFIRIVRRLRFSAGAPQPLSLGVLVQQLAALLRGGRGSSRLWEELWVVHAPPPEEDHHHMDRSRAALSPTALKVVSAARAAATVGSSPAQAIRAAAAKGYTQRRSPERRVWMELVACLDIAETSGCPLAALLTRFAAQLEAEEDSEAARQTALAGPKATVRLLSWLPVVGLVLGMALGVDPLGILLGNIFGAATLAAGLVLTVAGRVWSTRLVSSAAQGPA
nr:hypothetical protein [Arthrobacter sp. efr-133-TYG-104]